MVEIIGWRAKLGVMCPPYNCIVEPTMYDVVSHVSGVTVHFARPSWVWNKKPGVPITSEQIEEHLQGYDTLKMNLPYIKQAAYELSCADVNVIGLGCTAPAWDLLEDETVRLNDDAIIKTIEEVSGIKGTTTNASNFKAFKELGLKNIAVVMPYGNPFTNKKGRMIYEKYFNVVNCNDKVSRITHPNWVYEAARKADVPEADGIFISLTTVPFTTGLVEALENDIGKPVVTSNQAFTWNMLRLAGIPDKMSGYGKLFTL